MRILSIDYGEKRIGLAMSDPLGYTAQGLKTLERKNKKQVLADLKKICEDNGVGEVLIGLPINMNGSIGPKAKEVMEFVADAEAVLSLPIKTWDERLTSRQAGRMMTDAGVSQRKQRKSVDELAATLILQSYLESRRMSGK